MSNWTYIDGIVKVSPMGRTQEEKEYILKTVLKHLPNITGSEEDVKIRIMESCGGTVTSSSHDEFQMRTDNLTDRYGQRNRKNGWLECNEDYLIILEGHFRDRLFEQTYREFIKWLCRLAKRVSVDDILVRIKSYDKFEIITNPKLSTKYSYETKFGQLFETPSWVSDTTEPNWCEYLMWEKGIDTQMPMLLEYKYYNNDNNDKEVERRMKYDEQ